jgi:hypothetical protein
MYQSIKKKAETPILLQKQMFSGLLQFEEEKGIK